MPLVSALILAVLVLSGGLVTCWKRFMKQGVPRVTQHITGEAVKSAGRQVGQEAVQAGVERLVREQLAIPAGVDSHPRAGRSAAALSTTKEPGRQDLTREERLKVIEKELNRLEELFEDSSPPTPRPPRR